jgi:hypothetical protein
MLVGLHFHQVIGVQSKVMLNTRAAAYHKPVAEIGSTPARKEVRPTLCFCRLTTTQVIKKEDDSSVNGAMATKGETKHLKLTFRSTLPVTLHNALRQADRAREPAKPAPKRARSGSRKGAGLGFSRCISWRI